MPRRRRLRLRPVALGLTAALLSAAAPVAPPAGVARPPAEPERAADPALAATLDDVVRAHAALRRNLAHAATPGYRAVRAIFEHRRDVPGAGGAMRVSLEPIARPGFPVTTGRPLDVCVDGPGLIAVRGGEGAAYTRIGRLTVARDGHLRAGRAGGRNLPVHPPVIVPDAAAGLRVTPAGVVEALAPESHAWIELGRLTLASFPRPAALRADGALRFATTDAGRPLVGPPGSPGLGRLQTGRLEGSNVNPADDARQLRQLRAWSARLADALMRPDPLADPSDVAVVVAAR